MAPSFEDPADLGTNNPYRNSQWQEQQIVRVTLTEPSRTFSQYSSTRRDPDTVHVDFVELEPLTLNSGATNVAPEQEDTTAQRVSWAPPHLEDGMHGFVRRVQHSLRLDDAGRRSAQAKWDRFRGKGMRKVGWMESIVNTMSCSVLNIFLIFIPMAWAAYFTNKSSHALDPSIVFSLCWLSIIPLEKLFDFGGKQMQFYTGKRLGELIIVTLDNAVEAMLGIALLLKCQLRILQATIIGVVLLHLLLVPGTNFIVNGTRVYEQTLHPHYSQLNQTLLAIGVFCLIVPAALFSSVAATTPNDDDDDVSPGAIPTRYFLNMSHGISIILLTVYIASRVYLHKPPGESDAIPPTPIEPVGSRDFKRKMKGPRVNPWFCSLLLLLTMGILAVTVELLVSSIGYVRESGSITEEFFGLILLPIVSFSADAFLTILYFLRALLLLRPEPPSTTAEDRAIEASIQFALFWMPFFVLLAWTMQRPFLLIFDVYEIIVLVCASFLVNYVMADMKTNWAEGYIMVAFYTIIALCTWYYNGTAPHEAMLTSTCQPYEKSS